MLPVIGITPLWDEKLSSLWMLPGYADGITACGGLPVILPLTSDKRLVNRLFSMCDAILLTVAASLRAAAAPRHGNLPPARRSGQPAA